MTWSEQAGRAIVYARSQRLCEVCGRPAESVHHRVKAGQGGEWSPSNLLSSCGDGTRRCHGWIEAHPRAAMLLGLWVPSHADPSAVPMWCSPTALPRGWWTANMDGTWTWHLDRNHVPPPPDIAAALDSLRAARKISPGET